METILGHLRLQKYRQTFQKHNVDLATFLEMNEQSLINIGIKNDADISKLVLCVAKFKDFPFTRLSHISTGHMPDPTITNPHNKVLEWDEHYLFETMKSGLYNEPSTEVSPPLNDNSLTEQLALIVNRDAAFTDSLTAEQMSIISDGSTAISSTTDDGLVASPDEDRSSLSTILPNNESEPDLPSYDRATLTKFSRSRRQGSSSLEDATIIMRRDRLKGQQNRRMSVPTDVDPPGYHDAIQGPRGLKPTTIFEEVDNEPLPEYSCSIDKKGYVMRKTEKTASRRSCDRGWKKQYIRIWGTLLRVYKSEPIDYKRVSPLYELNLRDAEISFATDYHKRRNVIRIKFSSGPPWLIQVDREECIDWIETLQSAVNISSTLDEREMPQFVTLPNRRRRAYGYYTEMIRELQQLTPEEITQGQSTNW